MLKLYTPVYALTLLLSAALLFSVQPMFSKMILPLLGGTPNVWNTAMLFFQVTLLAGYAYAHGTTRFMSIKAQAFLHLALLVVFFFVLPFGIPEGTIPPLESDPTLWQLSLMALVVGGPFFVLSGSAPMFQRWFAASPHPDAHNPYFLYGASNLGSMSALFAYPFLIEPNAVLQGQAMGWMYGYISLIVCAIAALALIWPHSGKIELTLKSKTASAAGAISKVTMKDRGFWLLMAFLPSSLMLGVTAYITTDIASVPLLWILPLSLYVGTFIIVFARKEWIKKEHMLIAQAVLFGLLIAKTLAYNTVPPLAFIGFHILLFFACALVCHKELADSRPKAENLTEFYLFMSIGGALGGVFNALIAPNIFVIPIEYPLVLVACALIRYVRHDQYTLKITSEKLIADFRKDAFSTICTPRILTIAIIVCFATTMLFMNAAKLTILSLALLLMACSIMLVRSRWGLGLVVAYIMILNPPGYALIGSSLSDVVYQGRNFFGVVRVADSDSKKYRVLLHGTTNHGVQPLAEDMRLETLSYYGANSPFSDIMAHLDQKQGDQRIGIIGLGIGVTACYQRDDRFYDFYEIDPLIARIAENRDLFTYLSDCGSPYEILLGDGRLRIQDRDDGIYDLILMDAFSSDNIPVHLLTLEAIETFMAKLKPDGIIAFHISNNFLDLEPVLAAAADHLGVKHIAKIGIPENDYIDGLPYYISHYIVFLPESFDTTFLEEQFWSPGQRHDGYKLWTDNYSNIFKVLGQKSSRARYFDTLNRLEALRKDSNEIAHTSDEPETTDTILDAAEERLSDQ